MCVDLKMVIAHGPTQGLFYSMWSSDWTLFMERTWSDLEPTKLTIELQNTQTVALSSRTIAIAIEQW